MRFSGRVLRWLLSVLSVTAAVCVLAPAGAAPNTFVTMSDGVQIALNVRYPDDYVAGQTYPTLFEMSGYDGGAAQGQTLSGDIADRVDSVFPGGHANRNFPLQADSRQLSVYYNKDYFTIHASVRGTGCSGGEFDLFNARTALDGVEILRWIKSQSWSNKKIGIIGHSYGGITGFAVTAMDGYLASINGTAPEATAATLSGLIDDLYRGIVYPGGVSNYGFPLLWTGAIRNFYDLGGGMAPGLLRPLDDPTAETDRREQCAQNVTTHRRTVLGDPIVNGISDVDNDWWRSKGLVYLADRIRVPVHITGAYQDEQTGARGPAHLWEKIRNAPSKRLLLTNGDHGTNQDDRVMIEERKAWLDHWIKGTGDPYPSTSVRILFETHENNGMKWTAEKSGTTFPLADTSWTNYYLASEGSLSPSAPSGAEPADTYFSGSGRQSWSYQAGYSAGPPLTTSSGPDQLLYTSAAFQQPFAIAGPLTATLYISTTASDTELFAQVIDVAPDGSRTFLQRGLLKASHRAIDAAGSDKTSTGEIYRPMRPHTNPQDVSPGQVNEYLIEIWPVGHIFRAGHKLQLLVTAPPLVDSYYIYVPKRPVGLNTLYHDGSRPSRLMLPVVPVDLSGIGSELACGRQEAVRCVR